MSTDYNYDDQVRLFGGLERSGLWPEERTSGNNGLIANSSFYREHRDSFSLTLFLHFLGWSSCHSLIRLLHPANVVLPVLLNPQILRSLTLQPEPGLSKTPLLKDSTYKPPNSDLIDGARRRQAKRERRLKRFTSIVIGWVLFVYMAYLIATTKSVVGKIWDPYDILGISTVRRHIALF